MSIRSDLLTSCWRGRTRRLLCARTGFLTQAARGSVNKEGRDAETTLDQTQKHRHDGRGGKTASTQIWRSSRGSGQPPKRIWLRIVRRCAGACGPALALRPTADRPTAPQAGSARGG